MKLKNWLEKQRLTNREFAKMISVSESAIHRWTTTDDGKRMPRLEYIRAIEKATEGKVKPQDFYSSEKTRRYENQVSAYAAEAMKRMPPMAGPVEVVVQAFMIVPASWSLKKRLSAIAGQIKPVTKPDLDNIVKALDGMNGIIVVDDSQIVKLTATKQYAEIPQLIVTVIGQE